MRIQAYASFDELPPDYLSLFESWGSRSFFYSLPWLRNLAENILASDERLRIYGVEEESADKPVAALVTRFNPRRNGIVRSRQLTGLANYYSTLFGPVVDTSSGQIGEALAELARAIRAERPHWDIVKLTCLDPDSPAFVPLVQGLQSAGLLVQTYFMFGNWYLPVNGMKYSEYLESLPNNVKGSLKKAKKRVEKNGRTRLDVVTGGEKLEAAIQAYERIYRASWKKPEPFRNFMPGLMRTCAALGWLRVGILYVEDEPVAAHVYVVSGGVASGFKRAYDPRFARISPGNYLSTYMMEYVMDVDKVREIDVLTGDDPYKRYWMSHRRERWGLLAFNPRSLPGIVSIARHVGGRAIKSVWQQLTGGARGQADQLVRQS